jgi:hypothetical protein
MSFSTSNFPTEIIMKNLNLFWQYPVITEQEFFNQNKDNDLFCGFPWATIIDKKINLNIIVKILLPYIKHNNYYTCCQHISFRKLIPLFKILKIKTIYSPHKIKNENIINDIQILPCPLYAVNLEDKEKNIEFQNIDFINKKRLLLYSFIGGVQSNYISNIRNKIFSMKHNKAYTEIINTGEWHFNKVVYSEKQNIKGEININKEHKRKTKIYNQILLDSKFSLCPSGSGPNSIRFWESLGCGSIPVLLSDTLDLPYNIDWDNTIIQIKENEIENIDNILSNISKEREELLRKNCIKTYEKLKTNFRNK